MYVDENWAIFVSNIDRIEWTFGNPDQEFLTHTLNFLKGLGNIAEEAVGENSVASIEFDLEIHSGLKASEIMVISLQNQFFFICSDPSVTLKLIKATEGLPKSMEEIISAVLVGQAAILFANSISSAETILKTEVIEHHFQNLILDINPSLQKDISIICSKSSSNFSMLSFTDLLLFHYYIRKNKELTEQITPLKWVLISDLHGGELPFSWNVEKDVILSGYLSVVISFIQTLFNGSRPKRLNFGTQMIRKLEFIYGKKYFMALDSTFSHLCSDPDFIPNFFAIDSNVINDLTAQLKKHLISETIEIATLSLNELDLKTLLDSFSVYTEYSLSKNQKKQKFWQKIIARIR